MFTMTRDQAMEFLATGARTGKVATASLDGKVHVAPLWFVVEGQDLVFVTTATSVKGRHLHANPLAALCVDDDTNPCAFVTARHGGPLGRGHRPAGLDHPDRPPLPSSAVATS